jgi:hypothetical protein
VKIDQPSASIAILLIPSVGELAKRDAVRPMEMAWPTIGRFCDSSKGGLDALDEPACG